MGTICILLGLIFLICFSGVGFVVVNFLHDKLTGVHGMLASTVGGAGVFDGTIIGLFVFIGLLVCLNLVMHGLTYNKISKLYALKKKQLKK